MLTEQCVFLIFYILWYIVHVYNEVCVFLKLGESTLCIYVAMDLIPILLGSLPLAHNAQHSLVYQRSMQHINIAWVPGRARFNYA